MIVAGMWSRGAPASLCLDAAPIQKRPLCPGVAHIRPVDLEERNDPQRGRQQYCNKRMLRHNRLHVETKWHEHQQKWHCS